MFWAVTCQREVVMAELVSWMVVVHVFGRLVLLVLVVVVLIVCLWCAWWVYVVLESGGWV